MKIRIVSRKVGVDRTWLGTVISIVTGVWAIARLDFKNLKDDYSHSEIWFPGLSGFGTGEENNVFRGQTYSAANKGQEVGVRWEWADNVYDKPWRWVYQEIEVTWEQYYAIKAYADGQLGKKYDYLGLFTGFFMLAWHFQNDNRRYCSDFVAACLTAGGLFKKRHWIISPRRLVELIRNLLGIEVQELDYRLRKAVS